MVDELKVSQGPQVSGSGAVEETQLMQNMIESFDKIKESVDNHALAAHSQTATMADFAQKLLASYDDARKATGTTRDESNIHESIGRVLHEHVQEESNILLQYFDKVLVGGASLLGGAGSAVAGGVQSLASHLPSYEAGALGHSLAHALDIQSREGQQAINAFTGQIDELVTSFEGTLKSVESVTTALTALTGFLTLGGLVTGLVNAAKMMHKTHDFKVKLMKQAPQAADRIFDSISGYRNGMNLSSIDAMKRDLKENLIGADPDALLDSVIFAQLSQDKTVSAESMRNMAYTAGALKNRGVSPDVVKNSAASMIENLGMTSNEISYGLLSIANSAASSGLDITAYINKIVGMTVQFKSMGYTVSGIDKLFTDFSNTTLPSGSRMAYEASMEATKMFLDMRTNITDSMAAYISLARGGGLYAAGSEGFGGSSTSLGAMAANPLMAVVAGKMFKTGNVSGANEAMVDFYNWQVDTITGNMDTDGLSAGEKKDFRYLMTAQVMGLSDKYMAGGSTGEATQALVQKVANKDFKGDTSKLMSELKALTADPMDKVRKMVETDFPALMTDQNDRLVDQSNMFATFEQLSEEIQAILGGAMMPAMQEIASAMAAVGVFFKAGGFGALHKSLPEAGHAYEHTKHYFEEEKGFYGAVIGDENQINKVLGGIHDTVFEPYSEELKGTKRKYGSATSKGSNQSHLTRGKKKNKVYYTTNDLLTDDQAAFVDWLADATKDDPILKRIQISAATSHRGHSDGKGGEHAHGNAFDFGFAGMSEQQIKRLAQRLASSPAVIDIASTHKHGDHKKYRYLPKHTDHFHVRIKPGWSINKDGDATRNTYADITNPKAMSKANPLTFAPLGQPTTGFLGGKPTVASTSDITVTSGGRVIATKTVQGKAVGH